MCFRHQTIMIRFLAVGLTPSPSPCAPPSPLRHEDALEIVGRKLNFFGTYSSDTEQIFGDGEFVPRSVLRRDLTNFCVLPVWSRTER